jgi:DNA-binding winged helix-turn-helix (wHTH) protein
LGNSKVFADSIAVKVQFAEFTLDTDARRLIRHGNTEVHLSPKAFELLRVLIERRPNVLDKATLHAHLWPRTFVVDANLTVLVAELRRALADNAREPRFIRTVHALGYAFCVQLGPFDSGTAAAKFWLMWNDRAIVLAEGENIIGREPECGVWIDASSVSRRHARVDVERGGVVKVEDLGSKNGTLVDGTLVSGAVVVADGSVIQVGRVELTLRIWSRKETERIVRTPHDSQQPEE